MPFLKQIAHDCMEVEEVSVLFSESAENGFLSPTMGTDGVSYIVDIKRVFRLAEIDEAGIFSFCFFAYTSFQVTYHIFIVIHLTFSSVELNYR